MMLPKSNFSLLRVLSGTKKCNSVISSCTYSTETLEPIKMSYATYESAVKQNNYSNPLIITHGILGSKSNWNSLCKSYNQKCNPPRKIIAVDHRNHGDSPHSDKHTYAHMAADLKYFFEILSINKATVMGHSMGGRSAMLFALKYPELVDRLIIADISPVTTSPNLDLIPKVLQAIDTVELPSKVSMSKCRALLDEKLSYHFDDKALRAFILTNLVERTSGHFEWRINTPILLQTFNNIAKFPVLTDLQYTGPALFVAGSNSDFVKKSDFPKIQKLFPNAELKYIEGAGHWVHSEKPAEFLSLTLEFLNRKMDDQMDSKSKTT